MHFYDHTVWQGRVLGLKSAVQSTARKCTNKEGLTSLLVHLSRFFRDLFFSISFPDDFSLLIKAIHLSFYLYFLFEVEIFELCYGVYIFAVFGVIIFM